MSEFLDTVAFVGINWCTHMVFHAVFGKKLAK